MASFVNCHVHLFTSRAAPNRLLPGMPLIRGPVTGRIIGSILKRLSPFSGSDRLARLAAFSTIGRLEDEAILKLLRGYYTDEFTFAVMSLDMDFMGAGRAPQPYIEQLEALARLQKRHPGILLPFVCADPRRSDVLDVVRHYVEGHGFAGIKAYPSLGFWPSDARLDPVWAYAEEQGLPVLTHCSRGGIFYKGRITDELRIHPRTGAVERRRKRVTERLADPTNWTDVLDRFPGLRLCLAHYGGGEEWHRYLTKPLPIGERESWIGKITDLIIARPENVYADLSYTASETGFMGLIKLLTHRPDLQHNILFGSDFYMVQQKISERQFGIGLRAAIGEEAWRRIASENPRRWLGLEAEKALPPQVRVGEALTG